MGAVRKFFQFRADQINYFFLCPRQRQIISRSKDVDKTEHCMHASDMQRMQ